MTLRSLSSRLAPGAALVVLLALALPALAAASPPPPAGAVFVQTDGLTANRIVAYARAANGALTQVGTYETEGLGGQLSGSVVDHTASQGALAYDRGANLLLAANAGSDTISVFRVEGDRLALREVVSSGGRFPVSIAAQGGQAFVLNAEEGGSIQGYAILGGYLAPIWSEHRALHLATGKPGEETQFTHTPGELALTPSGRQLLVTTKAAGQSIEVFSVSPSGLASTPVTTADGSGVPFGFVFAPGNELLLAQAGPSALASLQLQANGSLGALDEVETGQAATCWVTAAGGRFFYTSNAGSASVTAFTVGLHGELEDLGNTKTHGGTVDGASTGDLLYVQGGAEGTVDEFRVLANGGLFEIGSVTVPGARGGEGIVAI